MDRSLMGQKTRDCVCIFLVIEAEIFLAALVCAQTVSLPDAPEVRARNHIAALSLHAVNEKGRDAFAFDGHLLNHEDKGMMAKILFK